MMRRSIQEGGRLAENMSKDNVQISVDEEKWYFHLIGFIGPLLVIYSNIIGGWWTISGTVLMLGIYPILDGLSGEDNPTKNIPKSGKPYEIMLHIHSLLHPVLVITLCWRAMQDGNAWTTWAAAFSTGISTGPHLHLEVWREFTPLDPIIYFPEYDSKKWTLINETRNYDLENKFSYSYLSYKV